MQLGDLRSLLKTDASMLLNALLVGAKTVDPAGMVTLFIASALRNNETFPMPASSFSPVVFGTCRIELIT